MKQASCFLSLALLALAVVAGAGPSAAAGQEPAPQAAAALTNADVIKMVRAGLGDELIVAAIRSAEGRAFDLGPDALIELKSAGVSQRVLMVMLESGPAAAHPAAPPPPPAKRRPEPVKPSPRHEGGRSGTTIGLIAGGAVAAGVAAVAISAGGNDAPERLSLDIAPPGDALVSATEVTFTGSAVDPEGDPLTFAWDFGDGTNASGRSVTHAYESEGTFTVVMRVEDSHGNAADMRGRVRARTLTGLWAVFSAGRDLGSAQFTQSGPVLEGFITSPANLFVGRVADPRRVSLKFFAASCRATFNLIGSVDDALNVMNLSSRSPNCAGEPFDLVLTR